MGFAAEPIESAASPPGLLGPGARVAGPELVTAKILAVDDDTRNLLAVSEMLRAPGLEIVTADSGEAALREVLKEDFAVILLDVQMPRIDGYELAAMIRGRPRSSRVPIIFLTAYNKDELHVFRGYTAGAVDYVFKPIEPLVLKSKVDVFVDLYRKTEEIRRQGEEERRLLVENLRVRGEKLRRNGRCGEPRRDRMRSCIRFRSWSHPEASRRRSRLFSSATMSSGSLGIRRSASPATLNLARAESTRRTWKTLQGTWGGSDDRIVCV
jgi:CheY-like chemotaxis protein